MRYRTEGVTFMARKRGKGGSEAAEAKKNRIAGSPIRNLILFAVASAIIGVAFILYPDVIERYCGYIIGGIIAVIGVANVICYFTKKTIDGVYRSEFAVGIIETAAGAYVALLSNGTLAFILLVLGILCAVDGLLKIQYTLDLARMHYAKWWLPLIMGALGLGIGVIIVMRRDLARDTQKYLPGLKPVLCANLPYNVTTPVLTKVYEAGCFDTAAVMVQKEVAERICALPGDAAYSSFSVFTRWYTQPEIAFTVGPECFMPQPKVTSAVVRMFSVIVPSSLTSTMYSTSAA